MTSLSPSSASDSVPVAPSSDDTPTPGVSSSTGAVTVHVEIDSSKASVHEVAEPPTGDQTNGQARSKALGPSLSSAGVYEPPPPVKLARCPEETANWLSFTYLWWLNGLFALGGHKTLEESDVPQVREDVSAAHISGLFAQNWTIQKARWDEEEAIKAKAEEEKAKEEQAKANGGKPNDATPGDANIPATPNGTPAAPTAPPPMKHISLGFNTTDKIGYSSYRLLYRTLYAMYGRRFWSAGLLKCMYDATNFTQPMLLSAFVSHIVKRQSANVNDHPPEWHGYALAAGMFGVAFVGVTMLNLFQRTVYGVGIRCRTALITALYRKSFKLSPAARAQMSTGQIVNMMSVDATMVDQACAWMHYGWSSFIQLIVAAALLIRALGAPALVGMAIMVIMVPMQAWVMKGLRFARRSALKYTDQRIRMLSEILQGIRVIKVYSWESSFIQQIGELRKKEMKFVRSASFIRGRNAITMQLGPILMALGTFIVLGATGGSLEPAEVFSSVVLFNLLRMPLMQIPNVMNMVADAQIGLNRVQKFLLAEELTDQPERLTVEEARKIQQKDLADIEKGQADPALEKAYKALLSNNTSIGSSPPDSSGSSSAASSPSTDDHFAIKITHGEFSWDILPEQIVKDDPAELAAAASGRGGGRGGRGRGGAGRGGARGGKSNANGTGENGAASSSRGGGRGGAAANGKGRGAKGSDEEDAALVPSKGGMPANGEVAAAGPPVLKVAPSVLHDITLVIPAGKLTIICGSVGASKSSLLSGLLGEMKKKHGEVQITGSVGFCAQQAWIQNTNVKNNILFGLPYDRKRYEETIRVCALTRDLKSSLPDGDLTEIGEKGINLSGGQKQRVNLARAFYFNSDIILMDDPLSAVDAHVSKYLFQECIQGAMAGKTRVLVTHQLQYIPQADFVVFLKDGKIHETGNYESLMAKEHSEFATLFRTHGGGDNSEEKEGGANETTNSEKLKTAAADDMKSDGTEKKQEQAEELAAAASKAANGSSSTKGVDGKSAPRVLMTTEERTTGGLSWRTWWYYLRAFGGIPWVTIIMLSVGSQMGIRIYNDYWLSGWTDDRYNRSNYFYIAIYGGLGVAACLASFFNIFLQVQRGYIAAIHIHDRCFSSLLRAPSSFFDTTPVGRVLNRFSRDQDIIDNSLSDSLRMLSFLSSSIIGVLVMMCFVQPWFILAILPILYLYYYFQNCYRRVNREIKRMDSTSRSPLFSHFSESLTGLPTIRAYRQQIPFIKTNEAKMDENNRFYFLIAASQRWLGTRLETLGGLIIFCTAIIAASNSTSIAAGLVGLSLSYAMQVTQMLSFFLRQSVESENFMNSVERSKFYTDSIAREAAPSLPIDSSPALSHDVWPSHGHIRFENVSMRYREGLKLVLHSVNIDIQGGSRIGIVGRTGAGKSSLMIALFRLVEICEGKIFIDGQDTKLLGLEKLRRSMAIIPQDPILFSGTVRSNLDPFGEYTDEQIWLVLSKAHLSERIQKLDGGLSAQVAESGDNFSVGEKCLLCMARAMLKNAKILIMDEATASVDMETDSLIQTSLRTHFQDCTILTIAHRLATIMDYDRVLVLDFGHIKEFDTPSNLLRKGGNANDNIFAGLVNETGVQTSELLRKLAFDAEKVAMARAQGSLSPSGEGALMQLENDALVAESSQLRPPRMGTNDFQALNSGQEEFDTADIDEHSMVQWHESDDGDEDAALLKSDSEDDQGTIVPNVHVQIRDNERT